jgi:hypothetical protein
LDDKPVRYFIAPDLGTPAREFFCFIKNDIILPGGLRAESDWIANRLIILVLGVRFPLRPPPKIPTLSRDFLFTNFICKKILRLPFDKLRVAQDDFVKTSLPRR